MYPEESLVSNVSPSNTGEVLHGVIASSLGLLFSQDHQAQYSSNDDVMDWDRTEGKAIGNFRVALADAPEAVFSGIGNDSEGGVASNQVDKQSILIADPYFRHLDTEHKCNICDRIFQNAHLLKKHKSVHDNNHPYQRPVCGLKSSEPNNINPNNMTHTGKQSFRCNICGRDFNRKCHMTTHQKTHDKKNLYRCDKCDKYCATPSNLMQHKIAHDNEHLRQCPVCDLKFQSFSKCKAHMETHQDIRPYQCDKCSKTFKTESTLYHHQNVHKDSKDIYCHYCDASYKSRNALRMHCKNKHPEQQYKMRSTNAGDAVISRLPLVIDQLSTSVTNTDLMTGENLNNIFGGDLYSAGWPFERLNKPDVDNLHDPAADFIASNQADKQSSLTAAHSFSRPATEHKCDI